ncbi:MAG: hypothetical protein AAB595_01290 [Patescibacteria group bacterium]
MYEVEVKAVLQNKQVVISKKDHLVGEKYDIMLYKIHKKLEIK